MLTVDFDQLGVKEGDIVLDAGCGFGRHSMEYMRRGAKVMALDMDIPSLEKTRFSMAAMAKEQGHGEFLAHSGDALNMPFKDETFDRVICSEVMEHVDDTQKACSELSRILKKNGHIAITVPTTFSEVLYFLLSYEYFTSPGGHVRIFTPKGLAKLMRENGLEVYGIGYKHSFHTIWWNIRNIVGLHNDKHPLTKGYHKFLELGLYSNRMRKIEKFFNWFFPKSVVIYAWKK